MKNKGFWYGWGFGLVILVSSSSFADILVSIDGQKFNDEKIAAEIGGQYLRAQTQCYDAKKGAIDSFLMNHLVGLEAEKKKMSREKLLQREIEGKASKVTDKAVKEFYDNYKRRAKAHGQEAPPFDKVSGEIRQRLTQENQRKRQSEYFSELKKRHKVTYHFSRPRVKVGTGDNPPKGPKTAKVTIVEFSDFECPFCKKANDGAVTEVMKKYRGKVKFYFRDFPLSFHRKAKQAAVAARCAGKQGKYWKYHDRLFAEQKLEESDLKDSAKALKLDMKSFETCLNSDKMKKAVDRDMEEGTKVGVSGTPAFFINGIPLSGAVPFSDFREIIEEELAKAGVKGGSSALMP